MKIVELLQNPILIAAVSGIVVSVIDLAIALNPNLKGNGILHAIYIFFVGQENQPKG